MKIRLATRRSPLALWQAERVAELLRRANDGLDVELVPTDTAPDRDLSMPITDFGGKGAFSKEVQALVLNGIADLAVHSAKDLQAVTPADLVIGAVPERGTPADCLVGATLATLPRGATVATGSQRRRALLLDQRPDLNVVGLRGNIGTRLARLAEVDAIVMAAVALERMGERPEAVEMLDPDTFVPQVGQGALAVECRADDVSTLELLASIDEADTRMTVEAERAFLARLGGDCELPAGAHAALGADGKLTMRGILAERTEAEAAGADGADSPAGPESSQQGLRGPKLWRAEVVELPTANPGRILAERLLAADPAP